MSAARRKGNRLEARWAAMIHAADGMSPELVQYQTATGRLGNTYRLQIDVASQRFAAECKLREDNPRRLWDWLAQVDGQGGKIGKTGLVVLGRNRLPDLVVLYADDFCDLLTGAK